jgi:hypothetical protein
VKNFRGDYCGCGTFIPELPKKRPRKEVVSPPVAADIGSWLASLGLEQYKGIFEENGLLSDLYAKRYDLLALGGAYA